MSLAAALLCLLFPPSGTGAAPADGILSGSVTDAAGLPVRGAVVEAMRRDPLGRLQPFLRTETDPEGRYRLSPLPGTVLRCWVRASAPGLVPGKEAADAGCVVPFRLRPGARIRGVVAAAAADGSPTVSWP